MIVHSVRKEPWIQKFRMTNPTFDELRYAVGSLVVPPPSCPKKPFPTDNKVSCDFDLFSSRFCETRLFRIARNATFCERRNFLGIYGGFFQG